MEQAMKYERYFPFVYTQRSMFCCSYCRTVLENRGETLVHPTSVPAADPQIGNETRVIDCPNIGDRVPNPDHFEAP